MRVRGGEVKTTFVEFEILSALWRARPGRVFTRDMLLARIWGDSAYRDPRTIDVHIRHLREKLERDPKEPEYIFTVRGVGYRFRDTDEPGYAPLRSLRWRLALLFFAIMLARDRRSIYLYVVPQLRVSLRDGEAAGARRRVARVLAPDRARRRSSTPTPASPGGRSARPPTALARG